MRKPDWLFIPLIFTFGCMLQNCIHEYPVPVPNSGVGEDPTIVDGYIELNYDLSWEKFLHNIEFSTKASKIDTHRFTVEVTDKDQTIIHDVEYISNEEFATGRFRRKLSIPLKASQYKIAAWYDRIDDTGNPYFNASDLKNITILNASTVDTLAFHCAFSTDTLDFRGYAGKINSLKVVKELEMQLPGARFQIVATDVQDFITEQKEALNQGDKFTVHLNLSSGAFNGFHAFDNYVSYSGGGYELEGRLRLPFAEYDEITIAQGFVFCQDEDELTMSISVKNPALSTVSKTDFFSIPIKRGYITVVKGDFLIHPVDGIFNINTIWAGEIIYEI